VVVSLRPTKHSPQAIELIVFDFDGVFTDNTVWVDENGRESVRCWRSDGLGLQKLAKANIPAWVLSTEVNPVVSARCQKLKIPCRQGLADKQQALMILCDELGVSLSHVAYLGNDINDAGCLEVVGFPMAVADAYPDVIKLACYQTTKPGGFGAVREVCDWLIAFKNETFTIEPVEFAPVESVLELSEIRISG
jgi:YrbI family 3-deoxy-D-manno-octulosonate 8-phosphate phosphatase